ncbi:MAG: hypothetical protein M3552_15465 [Planctomycetota bacterium]|nr:hypothetical protein [Planctomycetaceae bacterium]MDQ3332029.1 hypothetical protein [Planctomycetota bacterium]
MVAIVLNEEQTGVLNGASEPIEVRDASGRLVARIKPPAYEIPGENELIAQALRSRESNQPSYTSEQVQAHLRSLEEAKSAGATNEELRALLRRLQDSDAKAAG